MQLTGKTRIRKATVIHWYRKRTGKIRSNLHTGQYVGSVSPDHSQGQTLVEPLALPGGHQTHQQVSLQDHSKKGLCTCHTHQWSQLKVVIALEVMVFLAFCVLSCSRETSLSGIVFVGAPSKVSTTVASHTRLRPLCQWLKVRPLI